jgi:hypothetical protein
VRDVRSTSIARVSLSSLEFANRAAVFSYGPGLPGPAARSAAMAESGRPSAAGAGQARPVRMLSDLASTDTEQQGDFCLFSLCS